MVRCAARVQARVPVAAPGRFLPFRARAGRTAVVLLALLALVGACGPVARGGAAGPAGQWIETRPEDVLLITSFRHQSAAASDASSVFAAAPFGVVHYDQRFRRWAAPSTMEDGYPVGEVPADLALDDFTNTLWLGTRSGGVYTLPLGIAGRWRWVGDAPGGAVQALSAVDGSAYAMTHAGWYRVGSGGSGLMPVQPGQVPASAAAQAVPLLQRADRRGGSFAAAAEAAAVDRWLRRWTVTAAAESERPGRYWITTWGGGLFLYDDRSLTAEQRPFGLASIGAGAIAFDGGDVWVIGDGSADRAGVTRATRDLQQWYWYDARFENAPDAAGRVILPADARVWFGTAQGLYSLDRATERWRRLGEFDGLPSASVTALAGSSQALWVGTERGIAFGGPESFQTLPAGRGFHTYALAATDGRVWAGTAGGLIVFDAASGQQVAIPGGAQLDSLGLRSTLNRRVYGVAADAGRLFALAADRLLVYQAGRWREVGLPVPPMIGRPNGLTAQGGTVWVSAEGGAAVHDLAGGGWYPLVVGQGIPQGPVYQVLPAQEGVWFATRAGALWMPSR